MRHFLFWLCGSPHSPSGSCTHVVVLLPFTFYALQFLPDKFQEIDGGPLSSDAASFWHRSEHGAPEFMPATAEHFVPGLLHSAA